MIVANFLAGVKKAWGPKVYHRLQIITRANRMGWGAWMNPVAVGDDKHG